MSTEIIKQVAASGDDGGVEGSSFGDSGSFQTLGSWTSVASVFARFLNLTIPQGATIDSAKISFKEAFTANATPCPTRIYFNDVDDASTLPTSAATYNALAVTSEYVDWAVPVAAQATWYDSPDITDVIQEIVDRANWESGNDMLLLWKDNGAANYHYRQVRTYDNSSSDGVKLTINYTEAVTSNNNGFFALM